MKSTLGMRPAPGRKVHPLMWWALTGVLMAAIVSLFSAVLLQRPPVPAPAAAPATSLTAISTLAATPTPETPQSQAAWPPAGWNTGTLEANGFDSARMAKGLLDLRQKSVRIHSLMLVRGKSVLMDAYFYPYDGKTPHDLASVTKSMMTTLIGIAVDQGKLSLDDKVVSFFPGRTIENMDARKESITVRHLATMTSGLACTRARNEALRAQMMSTDDWVGYALNLPMSYDPGTHFQYCNPAIHILSGVLSKATGMSALEYAQQNLFGPLDIRDVRWPADPQGNNRGWGDIHLYPHDLAKIGRVWADGGQWQGKQIVSKQWTEDAVTGQIASDSGEDYGYGWWVGVEEQAGEYYADGVGGQRLGVYPFGDLIIVMTGGGMAYDQAMEPIIAALSDRIDPQPLPPNPDGERALAEALVTIAQPPDVARPVEPLPGAAKAISGKTFVFDPDSVVTTIRFDFNDTGEADFAWTVDSDEPTRGGRVGLDGVYRISVTPGTDNVPEAYRGSWTTPDTFVLDYDRVADSEGWVITFRFFGEAYEQVSVQARGRGGAAFKVAGRKQEP
jgi:CubicO group peptidase (beta-lactamase class C family)